MRMGANRGRPQKQLRDYYWGAVVEDGGEGLEVGPGVGPPKLEVPAGLVVLLAGWPTKPVFPPLMVCTSESGS